MFFQCGLGHLLGLDVHDMENLGEQYVGYTDTLKKRTDFGFRSLRLGRALEEGMVLTVEPGIYFIPELIDLRKKEGKFQELIDYEELEKYRDFGGIRVEDVFLITSNGAQILGNRLPTSATEIEEFMISYKRL
ncbi:M24 family metallopeptidase [Zobellia nedashkovskayae]